MSDEPKLQDDIPTQTPEADAWTMPEPVFQTSEGHNPKADTSKRAGKRAIGLDPQDISTAVTEEMPVYQAAPRGGLFSSFLFILITAIFGAAIVAAVYYFLTARSADTTF
jgi:hypothetical protein